MRTRNTTMRTIDCSASPLRQLGESPRKTPGSRQGLASLIGCLILLAPHYLFAQTAEPAKALAPPKVIREIFVPAEDLHVLLEAADRRVLLKREEYEKLLATAKQKPEEPHAPVPVALVAADYQGRIEDGRARLTGTLSLEVLDAGLCALSLPMSDVGLTAATLDGEPAALGRDANGGLILFVQGRGRHELKLEITAAVELSAAQQSIRCTLPTPPATKLRLSVPGDVEVKAGTPVVSRTVEQVGETRTTQLDLLLPRGSLSLVLSLNNKTLQQNRVVTARSVLVDEVTIAYERLHASISLAVLHGATDTFSFNVPQNFEITTVSTPLLSQWKVEQNGADRVLVVTLREPTTQPVVLKISALRAGVPVGQMADTFNNWKMPQLVPRDVAGSATVVGLFVEDRLRPDGLAPTELEPIDVDVLTAALPETVLLAEPGAPRIRPVAAYYAPRSNFELKARFERPAARFTATTNLMLTLEETRQQVLGGFAIRPEYDPLLSFEFTAPAGWNITEVTTADGAALQFDRYSGAMGSARVRVRLPKAVPPGQITSVNFQAVSTPSGWLGEWTQLPNVAFPAFTVVGAAQEEGAISVLAGDDLVPRPDKLVGLSPLSQSERARFRLADKPAQLAYRFDALPYNLTMIVERTAPDVTARAYHFARLSPGSLEMRTELVFDVRLARAGQLKFRLPDSTPASISITGRDGLVVKETRSDPPANGERVWTALLGERKSGVLKLVVEFNKTLDKADLKGLELPLAVVQGAAYQSSLVSVEGSPDLDVDVKTTARRVDIGELVDAEYQPGRRLVGVFGFLGDAPKLTVDVTPRQGYPLLTTIVERAELVTRVAGSGTSVNAARYHLKTKAQYLEVELPKDAKLWTALVDGNPTKPQRDAAGKLLLGWAATERATLRDVQLVYELPTIALGLATEVRFEAPKLFIRADRGSPAEEAPIADLRWQLLAPAGYKAVRSRGTVEPAETPTRILPAAKAAGAVIYLAGGVDLFHGQRRNEWNTWEFLPSYHRNAEYIAESSAVHDKSPKATRGMLVPLDGEYKSAESSYGEKSPAEEPAPTAMPEMPAPQASAPQSADYAMTVPQATPPLPPAPNDPFAAPAPVMAPPPPPPVAGLDLAGRAQAPSIGIYRTREGDQSGMGTLPQGGQPGGYQPTDGMLAQLPGGGPQRPTPVTPAAANPQPMPPGLAPQSPPPAAPKLAIWALEGVSSLPIDVTPLAGDTMVTFQSLGADPVLEATLADVGRWQLFAWGIFGLVVVAGLLLTMADLAAKLRLVVGVLLLVTLLPLVTGAFEELDPAFDAAFLAACLVGAWYILVAAYAWVREAFVTWYNTPAAPATPPAATSETVATVNPTPAAATTAMLLVAAMLWSSGVANAQELAKPVLPEGAIVTPEGTVVPIDALPPVKLPADAVVIPYEPTDDPRADIAKADRVLVPYAEYERLYRLANPDAKGPSPTLPAPFGLAGAQYSATLVDGDALTVTGKLTLDVFAEGSVAVPLAIEGGVLSQVLVDGKPARAALVGIAPPAANPNEQPAQQAEAMPNPNQPMVGPGGTLTRVYVEGKGRHTVDVVVRLKLDRRGGWRVVTGRVPRSPATSFVLTVPAAQTDVILNGLPDKPSYETKAANEKIETTVGVDGRLNLQWRPQVTEAMVDRSLAADSTAIFDVREDGLRLVWTVNLSFPRGQLERFTLAIPQGYLVEHVAGTNIRGWEQKAGMDREELNVTLLQSAKDKQSVTVHLAKRVKAVAELADFPLPVVNVVDAALHRGLITIRRSPLLELRTTKLENVSRADVPNDAAQYVDAREGAHESPLGVRAFQTYQFQSTPIAIQLAAEEIKSQATVELQSLAKISPREVRLETKLFVRPQGRSVHRLQVVIPAGLEIERVEPTSGLEWSLGQVEMKRVLNIYLVAGRIAPFEVLLFAKTPRLGVAGPMPDPMARAGEPGPEVTLPTLDVLNMTRQEGDIVVQVDPAFDVQPVELKGAESVLLSRTYGWLGGSQRSLARLALHYTNGAPSARLKIVRRNPRVSALTITNVRLTDRAIEETVFLEFNIEDAGIRHVTFQLPERFKEARVVTASLRQKTTTLVPDATGNRLRFDLELQDEILGQLRVVVMNDRLLSGEKQSAPIPLVETGTIDRQYVTLQNSGRDELEVVEARGLDALDRQQMAWQLLRDKLQHDVTMAYLAKSETRTPTLTYQTKQRSLVETATARITFAEAKLIVDKSGTYRGQQTYFVDNRTKPYFVVELPAKARLWTAHVAGQPVKPAPDSAGDRFVRIPLVKSAAGERNYLVELVYGGKMESLSSVTRVEFPLLKPVDLSPEASQVKLYLPETYHWGLFGGTARYAANKAEFEKDRLQYNTRQVHELLDTLNRGGDVYTKARLASNLKELQLEQQRFNAGNTALAQDSEGFRQAQQENEQALQLAEQNGKIVTAIDDSQSMEGDNRSRLNALVRDQENQRGLNVVNDPGRNFEVKDGTSQVAPVEENGAFQRDWFRSNGLDNPEAARLLAEGEKEGTRTESTPSDPGKPGGKYAGADRGSRIQLPAKTAPGKDDVADGRFGIKGVDGGFLPEVAQGRNREKLDELAQDQKKADEPMQADDAERSKGRRYQERYSRDLAARNANPQGQGQGNGQFGAPQVQTYGGEGRGGGGQQEWQLGLQYSTVPGTRTIQPGPGVGGPGPGALAGARPAQPQFFPGGTNQYEDNAGTRQPTTPQITGSAGLNQPQADFDSLQGLITTDGERGEFSSLTVNLPIRGQVYLFTAPRGEVTITAQGIDDSLLSRLIQAGVVLGVLLAAWFVYSFIRGGLAGLLIVVGLASVILGLFSIAGLVVLIVGAAMAIVDWRRSTVVVTPA